MIRLVHTIPKPEMSHLQTMGVEQENREMELIVYLFSTVLLLCCFFFLGSLEGGLG